MITQLERFIMQIQEITSSYRISPLVEYNGKVKLAFFQKNGRIHFILNYQFDYQKVIADVDFYFDEIENKLIDNDTKIVLVKILLVFFEHGEHQAISCNLKLTSSNSHLDSNSLFSNEEFTLWNKMWSRVGYYTSIKITEFQSSNNDTYSSKNSIIWKQNRNLEGDLFFYFYQEINSYSFEPAFIQQMNFRSNSIEIGFVNGVSSGDLLFFVENNNIYIKDSRTQKEIFYCTNLVVLKLWLQHYFKEHAIHSSHSTINQQIKHTKILIQRCIGEVPNNKLEFFAQNCLDYLQTKFPDENIEQCIEDNIESMEIYHLNERIVAVTYNNYLLCISKTSNLTWMSQKNLDFIITLK